MRNRWLARCCGRVAVTVLIGIGGVLAAPAQAQPSPNLKMGNPSEAQTDASLKDNYLLDRPYFATSYNNSRGTPNWVSWRLSAADIGKAPRDSFYADPDLPDGFLRVEPGEYTNSGFDRGHMCPHEDRSATDAASLATFSMTNIIPQAHNLNTKAWEALEDYCRSLVKQGKTCYILDGLAGQGGVGKNGPAQTTPDGKVVVPNQNWKVVMVLDQDVATATDLTVSSTIRLIAVIMPNNDNAVGENWTPFLTTVNQVEAQTGYTFFSAVDPAVINPLKGQPDSTNILFAPLPESGRIDPVIEKPAPATARPDTPRPIADAPAVPDAPAVVALKQAVAGLTYPSETDEPFEVLAWGPAEGRLTDAKLWHLAGQQPTARLERVPLDQFFARLVKPKHAQGQIKPAMAERFGALLTTIQGELTDVEVVRFGQIEVAIYIIGWTKDGKLVAIRTAATET